MNISIIGTGYFGLVAGTCFAEMGNQVICVDNNLEKLKKLQKAELPMYEPGLELYFYRNVAKKRLTFTDNLEHAVMNSEIIFLCLPAAQSEDGSPDLSGIYGVAENIGKILSCNQSNEFRVIVNKSTVPVGTAKAVSGIISKYGLKNFEVVSNPEFLREGFAVEDFMKPDRIIIGAQDPKAADMMKALYDPFVRQGNPVIEMDQESAEVTKYAVNTYLAARVTYMNELARLCEKVGADIDMVRIGMGSDSRIGKRFLFPGVGYGGSKDVANFIKTSIEIDSEMKILTVVDEVNRAQKEVLVEKIKNHFGGISGLRFTVWGLAFKPNTSDMRESPAIVIINKLLELGASVTAYDPAAMETAKGIFGNLIEYAADEYSALKDCDALLIITEWNEFRNPDFNIVKKELKQPVIFDGRNIFTKEKMKELCFTYYSIGRAAIK